MILLYGLISGIIATIFFDIYQIAIKYSYDINKTRWDLVGRYFIGLSSKKYNRKNLIEDEPEQFELMFGYLIHYIIGVMVKPFALLVKLKLF